MLNFFAERLARQLNLVLIVVVAALVFSVTWGVLTRSVAGLCVHLSETRGWEPWFWLPTGQAKWTEELARFLLIWVSLLGGAAAFGTKSHLGVDYFVDKFHPDIRKTIEFVANLVVLVFAGVLFFGGIQLVVDNLDQTTPALGWKMGWVYLAVPLTGKCIIVFTLKNMFGGPEPRELTSQPVQEGVKS